MIKRLDFQVKIILTINVIILSVIFGFIFTNYSIVRGKNK